VKPQKGIAILGSTGSIGQQAIEVVLSHQNEFKIEVLSAYNNVDLLIEQAFMLSPNVVVIGDKFLYSKVNSALSSKNIKVYAGESALNQVVEMSSIDIVLASIVGIAGLRSTLAAIEAGKPVALANKEALVVAGELITKTAAKKGVNIYPVDSEHSAIFQCLSGEFNNKIEKIYLTGSGGPFRGFNTKELQTVTVDEALRHPNWSMGNKITIDSASLMNKGLEIIEAKWLFNLQPDQIEVVIHPQSVIHSIVQFVDGSMKAQMGLPDMKLPIQYALSYPDRLVSDYERFDFNRYSSLDFEKPDIKTFRNLALALEAIKKGGNMPCILNAANEVAVNAFLAGQINFLKMPYIIEQCMNAVSFSKQADLDTYLDTDKEARRIASELIYSNGYTD